MAFEVTFELKESDLEYLRDVMRASKSEAKNLTETEILANAKSPSKDIQVDVPLFVSERIKKLATLVAMIEDSSGKYLTKSRLMY
jgi:hypothetical protein